MQFKWKTVNYIRASKNMISSMREFKALAESAVEWVFF